VRYSGGRRQDEVPHRVRVVQRVRACRTEGRGKKGRHMKGMRQEEEEEEEEEETEEGCRATTSAARATTHS
jgi:hypothetical protein